MELKPIWLGKYGQKFGEVSGDIVKKCDRHHQGKHCHAATLEVFHPGVGDTFASDSLSKIIHQVPSIEHWQR